MLHKFLTEMFECLLSPLECLKTQKKSIVVLSCVYYSEVIYEINLDYSIMVGDVVFFRINLLLDL